MKNDKTKNKNIIIIVFVVVIIILSALCILFATGTVDFSLNDNDNDNQLNNNVKDNIKENDEQQENSSEQGNTNIEDNIEEQENLSSKDFFGTVEVIGYPIIKEKIDELGNGEKYNYVYFYIKETNSNEFKQYVENLQGNAFVEKNAIGIGCIINSEIKYYNLSDDEGDKEYNLSKETTNKILTSTASNPIKLRLERLPLTYGGGAPVCYSHITKIQIAN